MTSLDPRKMNQRKNNLLKQQTIMVKYYVTYTSSIDHDCCTVWTEANSKQEAIDDVRSEYWDIEEIIDCYPA